MSSALFHEHIWHDQYVNIFHFKTELINTFNTTIICISFNKIHIIVFFFGFQIERASGRQEYALQGLG